MDIIGRLETPFHAPDQVVDPCSLGTNDPRNGTTIPGEFYLLARLHSTDQFGQMSLRFSKGNLHGPPPTLTNM
jgi:hypothetical protein